MIIRHYKSTDYRQLKDLYLDSSTFGGQFDEARDAADRLQKKIETDPAAYWQSLEGLDVIRLYNRLPDLAKVKFLIANDDEVLKTEYSDHLPIQIPIKL